MKDILNVVLMTLSGVIIILTLLQSGKSDKTADKAGRDNDSDRESYGMESSSATRSFNLSADS